MQKTGMLVSVIVILALLGGGIALERILNNTRPIALATVAAALITFFVFASTMQGSPTAGLSPESRLRTAMASALVVEYVVLVGISAFIRQGPEKLLPLTATLLTSFTATIGVVVAFYFGASAYVERNKP
jgi:uncharacterized membrane protein